MNSSFKTLRPGIFVGFQVVFRCKSVEYFIKFPLSFQPKFSGMMVVFLWNKSGTGFLTSIISNDIPVEYFTGTTEIPLE